ncbi:MAG: hypothetical protein R3C26_00115 [Calditrichia bacterium]
MPEMTTASPRLIFPAVTASQSDGQRRIRRIPDFRDVCVFFLLIGLFILPIKYLIRS